VSLAIERARKERAQAIEAEQRVRLKEGRYLLVEDVERARAADNSRCRAILLAASQTHADRVHAAAVAEGVRGVERELAALARAALLELAGLPPETRDGT
jgi:hypothetical protein